MLPLKYAYALAGNKLRIMRKFASEKITKKKRKTCRQSLSTGQIFLTKDICG
jgi:hypothetical protein